MLSVPPVDSCYISSIVAPTQSTADFGGRLSDGSLTFSGSGSTQIVNRSRSEYTLCYALLIVFESDDLGGCLTEAQSMKKELGENWGFFVEIYRIPFINNRKGLQDEVQNAVAAFILKYDGESNLLLVHYGGHGYVNKAGGYMIAMGHQGLLYEVRLAPIREQFLKCRADVGIIIDACQAYAGSYRRYHPHTVQILAACEENTDTPLVGPRSFTSAILHVLRNCSQGTLTLGDLRERLSTKYISSLETEPVLVTLRNSTWGSITLRRSQGSSADACSNGLIIGCRVARHISNLGNYFLRYKQPVEHSSEVVRVVEETKDGEFVVINWASSKI